MRSVLREDSPLGVLKDLLKTVNKITNRTEQGRNKSSYYLGGSIARYTKNLIMSFPVLTDETLNVETSQWISKACEKNTASMLEMLFSSMSINQKDKDATGVEVLRKFHRNIDSMSMDDIIDSTNDFVNAMETVYTPSINQGVINDARRAFTDDLVVPKKSFKENFSERGLNEYLTRPDYYGRGTMVFEAPSKYLAKQRAFKEEARMKEVAFIMEEEAAVNEAIEEGLLSEAPKAWVQAPNGKWYDAEVSDRERFIYQKQQDQQKQANLDAQAAQRAAEFEYQKKQDEYQQNKDYNLGLQQKRVKEIEYKKANELQPTLMVVNFNVVDDSGEEPVILDRKSFVAGIKCRLIMCGATDIMERVASVNKSQVSFKNLIRATTGEINLLNDFLLATSQQKYDAKNDVKKGEAAKVWGTLKKRATTNSYRKLARDKNDASAITTLIISQETANYIKATVGFEVDSVKGALQVMEAYNLLCIVIADETNEVAKFLYDGNTNFEALSFTVLAKEAMDKQYKKIVNVLK